jgi:catechol-2,3-dioxygenase
MNQPPTIIGVAEVALSVNDLPSMKKFYQDILGFELLSEACHENSEIADPDGKPTIVFLIIRDSTSPLGTHGHPLLLVLIDHRRHVFARNRLVGHDVSRSTLNHLAFEIPLEQYDSTLVRLNSLQLNPTESVFDHMNAKAIFFRDPEGNVLELICHVPR